MAHVVAEVRTVYRSARGVKLTKHAAYIAAAKKMIADRCAAWNELRMRGARGDSVSRDSEPCCQGSTHKCRFHTWPEHEAEVIYHPEGVEHRRVRDEVPYYRRVLDRLVRFLKHVDARESARSAS